MLLVLRVAGALVLLLALLLYIVNVISGGVKAEQKLGVPEMILIVVVVGLVSLLIAPGVLGRIQSFQIGQLEVRLEKVQNTQNEHGEELRTIRLALEFAVTEAERKHLNNLKQPNEIVQYSGNQALKIELRHLRELDLIKSKQYVANIPDGREFNLRDFVELTPHGEQYLKSIAE